MIVKNESHCIEKCLNSIIPFINYWVICDTGSSDNTEEVVKNCLNNIPGEYHHHSWEDFSTNRNKSLELAKCQSDYILIIDADDYIEIENKNIFNNLNELAYAIKIQHGNITYNRIQLISNKIQSKYIGVLHEYLELEPNIKVTFLDGIKIIFGASGSRSKDPNKYLNDAKILEKALLKDSNNSRYVFYAAQSYKDADKKEDALRLYLQRSEMSGWIQEQYISLLEIAKLYEFLYPNDLLKIESAYLRAYNLIPERLESLCYLCYFYRRHNMFHDSYFYAKIGINISIPKDALFLDISCYNWRIIDELAIAAYWINKKQEAKYLNISLLQKVPEEQKNRILTNLKFCI